MLLSCICIYRAWSKQELSGPVRKLSRAGLRGYLIYAAPNLAVPKGFKQLDSKKLSDHVVTPHSLALLDMSYN